MVRPAAGAEANELSVLARRALHALPLYALPWDGDILLAANLADEARAEGEAERAEGLGVAGSMHDASDDLQIRLTKRFLDKLAKALALAPAARKSIELVTRALRGQ